MSKPNEMSSWNDHDRWAALCSGTACPICCRREPLDVVAKLEACWVTMQEAAPVPGYACLVSQCHAVELHDLPEVAASAFMRDARRVSRALTAATGAVKLNYEIHGNLLLHLHMHVFPRYRGDQFEGQPIEPNSRFPDQGAWPTQPRDVSLACSRSHCTDESQL